MKKITLEKILYTLKNEDHIVHVMEEQADAAKETLTRMLDLAR